MTDLRTSLYKALSSGRLTANLESLGVKVTYTRSGVEIAGSTYEVRDLLRSAGFTWSPTFKVWTNTDTASSYLSLRRAIARRLNMAG